MRSRFLLAATLSFAVASGLLGACGENDENGATPAGLVEPELTGVVYEAETSDEALRAVLGVKALVDDGKAPIASEPAADGKVYDKGASPTFAWSPAVALRELPGLRRVREVFALRRALAHGDASTGVVYLVEVSKADGTPALRVFTSKTSYTPDAAAWAKLVGAGGTLSLRIIGARLENNALVPGGGPFVSSAPRTFSVAP